LRAPGQKWCGGSREKREHCAGALTLHLAHLAPLQNSRPRLTLPCPPIPPAQPPPHTHPHQITFLPVVTRKYWSVALDAISNSAPGAVAANITAATAILDTGTTAIIMSHEDAAAVHAGIPGVALTKGGYYNVTGGCGAVDALPDLAFTLGGATFELPARLWIQQIPATGGEDPALMCVSAIIPGPTNKERGVVLGNAFLRAWYSVYEVDGPPGAETGGRVGLARSASVATPLGKGVERAEAVAEGRAGGGGPKDGVIGRRLL